MTKKSLLGVALPVLMFTVGWTAANSLTPKAEAESTQLKVLKVFTAKDGEALYRAYLVKWTDQEVIVPDTLVKSNYQVGDTATVVVMRHKFPNEKPGPDLLSFAMEPASR